MDAVTEWILSLTTPSTAWQFELLLLAIQPVRWEPLQWPQRHDWRGNLHPAVTELKLHLTPLAHVEGEVLVRVKVLSRDENWYDFNDSDSITILSYRFDSLSIQFLIDSLIDYFWARKKKSTNEFIYINFLSYNILWIDDAQHMQYVCIHLHVLNNQKQT